ncbi:MAG: cation-translocating P-type ATPase [Oscillospiraceae bacterium]|nr:cation-translocating P-type ATPase [Oscillospiraceae bacterium]
MSKGYNVDDILREIEERKRARDNLVQSSRAAAEAPQPVVREVQQPVPQPVVREVQQPVPQPVVHEVQQPVRQEARRPSHNRLGDDFDWGLKDRPRRQPRTISVEEDMDIQATQSWSAADVAPKQEEQKENFVIDWSEEEPASGFDARSEDTRVDIPVPRGFGSKVMAGEFGGGGLEPEEGDSLYDDREDFEDDEDMLEYRSPADARVVWQDLVSQKSGLLVRLMMTGLCGLVLTYLALSYEYPLPLPTFLWPETHLRTYFIVNMVLTALAVLINSNTVGGGLISLITFKADNDAFAAMASIASLVQSVALLVAPERFAGSGLHFYTPVAVMILFFNIIGKMSFAGRIMRNFRTVAGERRAHSATMLVSSKEMARDMTRGQNLDFPQIVYSVKTGFFSNFLELSYEEDYSDGVARVLAPVSFIASLLVALVSFLFNKNAFTALSVFAASACICAPVGAQLVGNLPQGRLSKVLSREGAMVSGYGAVDRLSRANAVAMRCSDLFPAESITLHRIKTFRRTALDEAIIDAASVICSCESTLSGIFNQMVGGRTDMLKPVENLVCEDGMGLSAWVSGKRVLIGNRELMHQHGIELPGWEVESQLQLEGSNLLYLANSGQLTAIYVLGYGCNRDIAEALEELADRDMTLVVYTTDPNITPGLIDSVLGYPAELVKILPAKLHNSFEELTQSRESVPAYTAHNGGVDQFVYTITAAENCRSAITFGAILQLVFVIVGFALITFMAFMQKISVISWMLVGLFQLVCGMLACLLPNMRRL